MSIEVMRQALEYVQEFKRRWWAVPPFGNKVNKATREAVSAAHSPIFQIEDALRAAIEQYDQTALELCKECGWRAMIPGEGCLTCARQKAQPVAWMHVQGNYEEPLLRQLDDFELDRGWEQYPLYAAPRQLVGLTNKDIIEMWPETSTVGWDDIRLIEAKLKEKNAA
jgi:hypothetical protein